MADEAKKKAAPPIADKAANAAGDAPKEGEQRAPESTAKTTKKLSPLVLAMSAVVSLVIFLAVFSYFMGVFDAKPPASVKPAASAPPTGDTVPAMPAPYYSEFGRAAAGMEEAARDTSRVDTAAVLADLDRRRQELAVEAASVQAEKRELQRLKSEVERLLARQSGVANEKVLYMAKLLDGMKPEELTPLMTKLDNSTILAVLPNMKPQNASKVLALLPPERAAEIATQLLSPTP